MLLFKLCVFHLGVSFVTEVSELLEILPLSDLETATVFEDKEETFVVGVVVERLNFSTILEDSDLSVLTPSSTFVEEELTLTLPPLLDRGLTLVGDVFTLPPLIHGTGSFDLLDDSNFDVVANDDAKAPESMDFDIADSVLLLKESELFISDVGVDAADLDVVSFVMLVNTSLETELSFFSSFFSSFLSSDFSSLSWRPVFRRARANHSGSLDAADVRTLSRTRGDASGEAFCELFGSTRCEAAL